MLTQLAAALSLVLVPVLMGALVTLASGAARNAGVRVPRVMREGPWRSAP
jgi:hypothetical protein